MCADAAVLTHIMCTRVTMPYLLLCSVYKVGTEHWPGIDVIASLYPVSKIGLVGLFHLPAGSAPGSMKANFSKTS